MGEIISLEAAEFGRCRKISKMILEAEEFILEARAEWERLASEFSSLKRTIETEEDHEPASRRMLHDSRHGMHIVVS